LRGGLTILRTKRLEIDVALHQCESAMGGVASHTISCGALRYCAEKANEGLLSPEDAAEYSRYREAFHFVTILQAKARRLLTNQ
jgi:hypothetical protein